MRYGTLYIMITLHYNIIVIFKKVMFLEKNIQNNYVHLPKRSNFALSYIYFIIDQTFR